MLVLQAASCGGAPGAELPRLRVDDTGRFLEDTTGRPFFYLADSAWGLFHKTDREEALLYLDDRSSRGFNVVQASITAAGFWPGLGPNRFGEAPFEANDPSRPNEAFFRYVDWVLDRAARRGLYVALLPTWGEYVCPAHHDGPKIFDVRNAGLYGRWLGERYRERTNLVWIIGGDRLPDRCDPGDLEVWRALAEGVVSGVASGGGPDPLLSYHPQGAAHSSTALHDESWLDFNMVQSSHCRDAPVYDMIALDRSREPAKPTLDGEAAYENIPSCLERDARRIDAYDVRRSAWWSTFAGAAGHAYGAAEVFSFWSPGDPDAEGWYEQPWKVALGYPGADQMRHLRTLMESRPFATRIPDQSLLVGEAGLWGQRMQATRDEAGTYLFVYLATGRPVTVRTERLTGEALKAFWFDPRTGSSRVIGEFRSGAPRAFTPPSEQDWVLVIEDASRGFPLPGTAS